MGGSREVFEHVSLLVTHYNRSNSLEKLLSSLEREGCYFGEIVVSDDCSKPEHIAKLEVLRDRFHFTLITANRNGGLAANINKGQAAIKTAYTLYVQEDFIALPGCLEHLRNGMTLMAENPDYDFVRFYAYDKYPFLQPHKFGFSTMHFKFWSLSFGKFNFYSDHPHIRRNSFTAKFGGYKEGISGDKTEFAMMMSVLRKGGKSFFFNGYKSVFEQENTAMEPSTMSRGYFRNSGNFLVAMVRVIYRFVNYNFGYLFGRPLRWS